MRHRPDRAVPLVALIAALLAAAPAAAQEAATRPAVPPVDPGASPTLGARPPLHDHSVRTLFDGRDVEGWQMPDGRPCAWIVQPDGSVEVQGGNAMTRDHFGDFQLHLEFRCPILKGRTGQAKGNSGVYIHGRYEVQVLDTFGEAPAGNGCGALYSIAAPMINASRPAGAWQSYDIIFRAPRFDDDGDVSEQPRITVLHNGLIIHNNRILPDTTPGGIDREMVAAGPILLQDHGDPVRYRNMWLRELEEAE